MRFIDSYAFLACGLDKLISNLDNQHKHHLQTKFGDNFNLANKKGHFPYDWFNNLSHDRDFLVLDPFISDVCCDFEATRSKLARLYGALEAPH
jgi:hypothetical protein